MRILAYMGHPAHFHLLKNAILNLQKKGHETLVLIQTKDILERLLKGAGIEYQNVLVERRKDHPVSIALSLLSKDWHMIKLAKKFKPDLLVGTSVEITHVGKFIGRPSVVVNEDDWDYIPRFANMGYPFASTILLPDNCRAGKALPHFARNSIDKRQIGVAIPAARGRAHGNEDGAGAINRACQIF